MENDSAKEKAALSIRELKKLAEQILEIAAPISDKQFKMLMSIVSAKRTPISFPEAQAKMIKLRENMHILFAESKIALQRSREAVEHTRQLGLPPRNNESEIPNPSNSD